ncbi:hypothetical protein [Actinomadura vinacea]
MALPSLAAFGLIAGTPTMTWAENSAPAAAHSSTEAVARPAGAALHVRDVSVGRDGRTYYTDSYYLATARGATVQQTQSVADPAAPGQPAAGGSGQAGAKTAPGQKPDAAGPTSGQQAQAAPAKPAASGTPAGQAAPARQGAPAGKGAARPARGHAAPSKPVKRRVHKKTRRGPVKHVGRRDWMRMPAEPAMPPEPRMPAPPPMPAEFRGGAFGP